MQTTNLIFYYRSRYFEYESVLVFYVSFENTLGWAFVKIIEACNGRACNNLTTVMLLFSMCLPFQAFYEMCFQLGDTDCITNMPCGIVKHFMKF